MRTSLPHTEIDQTNEDVEKRPKVNIEEEGTAYDGEWKKGSNER